MKDILLLGNVYFIQIYGKLWCQLKLISPLGHALVNAITCRTIQKSIGLIRSKGYTEI